MVGRRCEHLDLQCLRHALKEIRQKLWVAVADYPQWIRPIADFEILDPRGGPLLGRLVVTARGKAHLLRGLTSGCKERIVVEGGLGFGDCHHLIHRHYIEGYHLQLNRLQLSVRLVA